MQAFPTSTDLSIYPYIYEERGLGVSMTSDRLMPPQLTPELNVSGKKPAPSSLK